MDSTCGIIAPVRNGMPHDEHGCILPHGHDGYHVYADGDATVQWQTDPTCDCDDCHSDEPDDWCVIWGRALRGD